MAAMNFSRVLRALIFVPLFPFAAPAQAAFYCGSAVVVVGASQEQVASSCGQPAWADSRVIYERQGFANPYFGGAVVEIVVDEWVYNFGPTRFMQKVIFRNGVLTGIRTLGYGD